jgi:hypothetical protein
MAYAKTAIIQAAANTATGQQTFTVPHISWTPNAAIFIASGSDENGVAAATARLSFGCATSDTEQWATFIRSADNVGTTDTASGFLIDACVAFFEDTGTSIEGVASFVSFGVGEVTINWTTVPEAPFLITVIFISCDNALAGTYEMGSSDGGITTVNLGFEADVLLAGYVALVTDMVDDPAYLSLGVAHNGGSITQQCHTINDSHGAAATAVSGRLDTDYIAVHMAGSVDKASEITSFTATEFVATQRVAGGNLGESIGYLALDLGDSTAAIGQFTTATAKQYQHVTGVGLRPHLVLMGLFNGAAVDTDYANNQGGSYGAGVATWEREYSHVISSEDDADPTNAQSLADNVAANLPDDDGTAQYQATLTRMDSGGFTLYWRDVPTVAAAKAWWYLAIQNDPVAEYTQFRLFNPDAKLRAHLTNIDDYSLHTDSWSPQVAGDKPGQAAGRPYNQVIENIGLMATGSDRAAALENLEKLYRLLKLTEEWRRDMTGGVTDTATLFQWEAQGSSAGAWDMMVNGRPDKTRPFLRLPNSFNEKLVLQQIDNTGLEFLREGELLGDIETPSASSAVPTGDTMTVTFSNDWPVHSPVHLTIAGFGGGASVLQESWLLIAKDASDLVLVEAEAGGAGVTINEDANNARGTAANNAKRFTGGATYGVVSFIIGSDPLPHKTVGIWGVVRKNNAAASWRLYCTTKEASGVVNGQTHVTVLDGSSTSPQVHFFGTVQSAGKDHTQLLLYYLEGDATTLDIDYFVVMGMDNPINRALRLRPSSEVVGIDNIQVDPRQLTGIAPRITGNNSVPQTFSIPWDSGSAYTISAGTSLSAVLLAPRSNYWRWSSGSTLQNLTLTATRQRAVLIPR